MLALARQTSDADDGRSSGVRYNAVDRRVCDGRNRSILGEYRVVEKVIPGTGFFFYFPLFPAPLSIYFPEIGTNFFLNFFPNRNYL